MVGRYFIRVQKRARAGAALAQTDHGLYVIGGELKPRVRSNQIVKYPKR